MSKFRLKWSLPLILGLSLMGCEIPLEPTISLPNNKPSSETPTENQGEPPSCKETLQCIVDNTDDNVLRLQAQEVLTELLKIGEPQYTRLCESKAKELVVQSAECKK